MWQRRRLYLAADIGTLATPHTTGHQKGARRTTHQHAGGTTETWQAIVPQERWHRGAIFGAQPELSEPTQANSGSPKYYSALLSGLPMFRPPFLEARTRKTQISARQAAKGRAGYSVFGKAPALAELKAVGETTPSQPCRRGPRVLRVAPHLLAAVDARQYALVFPVAAQHRARRQLACIASRLPRRLSRRVLQRGKCTSIFGPFPPSVQLSGGHPGLCLLVAGLLQCVCVSRRCGG